MKTAHGRDCAESITKKLSAVIIPIDDFSGDRPHGRVRVTIEGCAVKPVKTPGGFYVFVKLLPGSYRFMIESDYYLPFSGELIVSQDNAERPPVVDARLIPSVSYPFSSDCTLIRGSVSDKYGQTVSGALVKAGILPGSQRVLKLGKVNLISGNTMEVTLDNPLNAIERFNILEIGTTGNKIETCRVRDVLKKEAEIESVLLQETLIYSHKGHAVTLLEVDAVETRSDEKGEFVLYFGSLSESTLNVKIETSFENREFANLVNGKEQDGITVTELGTTIVKVIEK